MQLVNNLTELQSALQNPRDAVYECHDLLETYYKYTEKRFLDTVHQVGDQLIQSTSGTIYKFNTDWVQQLSDAELNAICGKEPTRVAKRRHLSSQIERFEEATEQVAVIIPGLRSRLIRRTQSPPFHHDTQIPRSGGQRVPQSGRRTEHTHGQAAPQR